jgi:hypothetical protein
MALDKDRVADNIVDRIEADFGITFTVDQRANARKIWNLVADEMIKEIKLFGDIVLLQGDIQVPALGLLDGDGQPVTGTAETAAVTLTGRLD